MKPFILPAINPHFGEVLIETPGQLFEILQYQNPGTLKEYIGHLPWYVQVFDRGSKLKIKVFTPPVVFEDLLQ